MQGARVVGRVPGAKGEDEDDDSDTDVGGVSAERSSAPDVWRRVDDRGGKGRIGETTCKCQNACGTTPPGPCCPRVLVFVLTTLSPAPSCRASASCCACCYETDASMCPELSRPASVHNHRKALAGALLRHSESPPALIRITAVPPPDRSSGRRPKRVREGPRGWRCGAQPADGGACCISGWEELL